MKATDELKAEHRVILEALSLLEAMALEARRRGRIPEVHARELIDFAATYADRCHHAKEEDYLFPALIRSGLPEDACVLRVMLREHELGRSWVVRMRQALEAQERGAAEAGRWFHDAALGYVELLRNHITKEDNILFPLADRIFPAETQASLQAAFRRVAEDADHAREKTRALELLESLRDRTRAAVDATT